MTHRHMTHPRVRLAGLVLTLTLFGAGITACASNDNGGVILPPPPSSTTTVAGTTPTS
jgi:hypothetical protein